ncbi:MAG: YitT family protein [Desulfovibrionales bacterium]
MKTQEITYSIPWNLFLITVGSVIFSVSLKGIALPHNFIAGGLFGSSLLLHYATGLLSAGVIYFLLNLPMFVIGWRYIGRRFMFYSLFAMVVTSLAFEVITVDFGIKNQLYAAVACGVLSGFGAGIVLRSLGSNGGLDVVAVWLFQRYNIGIGKFYLLFNLVLFLLTAMFLDIDLVIASLIMVFISSGMVEHTLSMFSQRKVVLIVSDKTEDIAREVLSRLKLGATFIKGQGAYSGRDKNILMTVINNIQLKKLEEIVFTEDEQALFIVENTFNVLGSSFSKRKIY